jgi:hypothetical protein
MRGEENSVTHASEGEKREIGEQTQSSRDDLYDRSTSPQTTEMLISAYVKGVTHLHTHAQSWTNLSFEFLSVAHIFTLSITFPKP